MRNNHRLFLVLMGMLFVWGTVLAVGAYRFNAHPGRFGLVFGCTLGFLAFWILMLGLRRRRLERETPR